MTKIEYTVNNTKKGIQWDNTNRGIDDFATVRVFDSAYTEGLLKKRDSDNLLVKPYGLNAFAELISKIDDLLNNARVELAKREIPEVDKSELSDEIKALFDKKKFEQEDIEQFKLLATFFPKEDAEFLTNAKRYCAQKGYDFIWFCKDIECVYLGKKIDDSQKKKESATFKAKKLIEAVEERKLVADNYIKQIRAIL